MRIPMAVGDDQKTVWFVELFFGVSGFNKLSLLRFPKRVEDRFDIKSIKVIVN